mgnify:CR=1 FL=1
MKQSYDPIPGGPRRFLLRAPRPPRPAAARRRAAKKSPPIKAAP